MTDVTLTQYVTVIALAFFVGSLVGFLGSVFAMAPRLPPREPPEELLERMERRQRIHIASRTKH